MTKGEALGIYHLRFEKMESREIGPRRGLREIAQAVAEHIALALGNLQLRETLHQQSTRDPLTGLFNRRHMEDSLERELRRAERAGRPLGVILFDLDHFKRFNDAFGHDAGDYLLKELAHSMTRHSRKEDIACRYGGEEFLLIMPEASLQTAQHRAEQLRLEIKRKAWECRGRLLGPVTLSCGVSAFPRHGRSREELLLAADAALYQAKREGRDRVSVSPEPRVSAIPGAACRRPMKPGERRLAPRNSLASISSYCFLVAPVPADFLVADLAAGAATPTMTVVLITSSFGKFACK